ncbi:MAG: hypothetical protein DMG57_18790 [Acidobacteria bacterium]|nr:MAG: hypothetical protein DMG57_18790 [Acidobacteriota bacterium]
MEQRLLVLGIDFERALQRMRRLRILVGHQVQLTEGNQRPSRMGRLGYRGPKDLLRAGSIFARQLDHSQGHC